MKKILIVLALVLFAVPAFASAELVPEPAVIPDGPLSQYPITTSRPPVSVPTAPAGGISFSGSGGQCLPYWPWAPTVHTPCWYEIQLMVANLK